MSAPPASRHSRAGDEAGMTTHATREPVGEIRIVDPNELNWLFITWNTMEEPVRTDEHGRIVGAAMEGSRWIDETTLEVDVRREVRFQDGTSSAPSTRFSAGARPTRRAPTSTSTPTRAATSSTTTPSASSSPHPTARARQVPRHARGLVALLELGGVRVPRAGDRRRSLVSDRRAGPVGHRTVRAQGGLFDPRQRDRLHRRGAAHLRLAQPRPAPQRPGRARGLPRPLERRARPAPRARGLPQRSRPRPRARARVHHRG